MALLAGTLRCAPTPDELPEVKTRVYLSSEPCLEPPRAIAPSASSPEIGDCVETAWAVKCEGTMSFDVDVDEGGRLAEVRLHVAAAT